MGKKICPMLKPNERTGLQRKCLEGDCAWYVDGACAAITNAKKENICSKNSNEALAVLAKYPEFREAVGVAAQCDAKIKKIIAEHLHSICEEEDLSLSSPPSFPPSPEEFQDLLDTLGYAREMWKAAEGEITILTKEKEKDEKRISDLEGVVLKLQRDLADSEEKRRHLLEVSNERTADLEQRLESYKKDLAESKDLHEKSLLLLAEERDAAIKECLEMKEAYNELLEMSEKKREELDGEIELLKTSLNDTKNSEFSHKMKELRMREGLKESAASFEIYDVNGEMWKCDPETFPDIIALRLQWDSELGWGNLEFTYNTKTHEWNIDSECMSEEFCLAILKHWLHLVYTGEKKMQKLYYPGAEDGEKTE